MSYYPPQTYRPGYPSEYSREEIEKQEGYSRGPQNYNPQNYSPQAYPAQGYYPSNYFPSNNPQRLQEYVSEPYSQNIPQECLPNYPFQSLPQTTPYYRQEENPETFQPRLFEAKALVYTCMDFRLLDDIVQFMNEKGLTCNYDQFILAGVSLPFVEEKFKHWRKVAKQHLDLAIQLHKIEEIICLEHEQCGAYKLSYPDLTPENERNQHIQNVEVFERKMLKSHPTLTFSAFYMHIDGSTERIN